MRLAQMTAIAFLVATSAQAATLTPEAKDAVLRALDDEYHAQQIYAETMKKLGDIRPFSNIINAEVQHASALVALLERYGEPVPETPYASGAKPLEAIPATKAEACAVGVVAEIENIRLYNEELLHAVTAYPDVTQLFTNLRDASEQKHLPAFQRCGGGGGQGAQRGHGGMGHGGHGGKGMGRGRG